VEEGFNATGFHNAEGRGAPNMLPEIPEKFLQHFGDCRAYVKEDLKG
jgi:hypothetical protein